MTIKIISGFVVGAAIGTITGLLLAPSSGKKTRNDISKRSVKLKNEIAEAVNNYFDTLKNKRFSNEQVSNGAYNKENAIV